MTIGAISRKGLIEWIPKRLSQRLNWKKQEVIRLRWQQTQFQRK